jgi:hypothetical protein
MFPTRQHRIVKTSFPAIYKEKKTVEWNYGIDAVQRLYLYEVIHVHVLF